MSLEGVVPKHDLTDPGANPDQILYDREQVVEQVKAMAELEELSKLLMKETEELDYEKAEKKARGLLLDIDSFRTLRNHEIVSTFFNDFRLSLAEEHFEDNSIPEDVRGQLLYERANR